MTTHTRPGAPLMPDWHRPFLRYLVTPDQGGAGSGDDTKGPEGDGAANGGDANANGGDDTEHIEGQEALGDPGKKALDAMKTERNAARVAEREAKAALAALQAQVAGKQAEHDAEVAAQKVKDEALDKANLRIVKSEIRVAAAGKLSDPADALNFIDPATVDVDDEGNVDSAAIAAAIDELLTKKPYLAAQGGSRFQGNGDGGARKGATKPPQLTEADVDRLSAEGRHDEIVKAKAEGRLDDYLKS